MSKFSRAKIFFILTTLSMLSLFSCEKSEEEEQLELEAQIAELVREFPELHLKFKKNTSSIGKDIKSINELRSKLLLYRNEIEL